MRHLLSTVKHQYPKTEIGGIRDHVQKLQEGCIRSAFPGAKEGDCE